MKPIRYSALIVIFAATFSTGLCGILSQATLPDQQTTQLIDGSNGGGEEFLIDGSNGGGEEFLIDGSNGGGEEF